MNRAATRPRATRAAPARAAAAAVFARQASPPPQQTPVAAPPSSTSAPPFGRLLLAAFHSVGVDFVALDHLRKAKKNALNAREYADLWRLLHDLVVVVLLDFDVDVDAIRASSSSSADVSDLPLYQELVRVYLYEWGFVHSAFYTDKAPAASVLLLALAWLLAHSRLFERQHDAILQLYVAKATAPHSARLPPYPNDVSLAESAVHDAVETIVAEHEEILQRLTSTRSSAQLHQLQAVVGRIYAHTRALQSAVQSFSKMLIRLEDRQRQSGAVEDDELLPAYALQVFAQGKSALELHMRVMSERLQMLEDEKLFYKWINSLLLPAASGVQSQAQEADADEAADEEAAALKHREAAMQTLAVEYADLYREMRLTRAKVEASGALCRQVAGLYTQEKQKWRQKPKTRTQQVKMDDKMEKLKADIATNELWDASAMLLESRGGQSGGSGGQPGSARKSIRELKSRRPVERERAREREPPVREAELVQLQQQLERVMREITTEYCRVELK